MSKRPLFKCLKNSKVDMKRRHGGFGQVLTSPSFKPRLARYSAASSLFMEFWSNLSAASSRYSSISSILSLRVSSSSFSAYDLLAALTTAVIFMIQTSMSGASTL